ncbi:MAG TPA: hypothetical protein PKA39_15475, partial [Ignavibacteria bacterium]|nr:hypothetical protein [Ignavibacteria bacterium]
MFKATGYDMLHIIDKIESELDRKDMFQRVSENIKKKQIGEVEIVNYSPELKEHFRVLNYEWLTKYFTVEPEDKKLLEDPENEIIVNG